MPDTTVRIREIAYRLWEDEGRPADRHLEHWATAERMANMGELAKSSPIQKRAPKPRKRASAKK